MGPAVTVSLRTARLMLRPWRDADGAAFAAISADPAVMEFLDPLTEPGRRSLGDARARPLATSTGLGNGSSSCPARPILSALSVLPNTSYQAHFTPAVEVAWRLVRGYWGRGFAAEAARAALDHGFCKLGLAEIVAVTVPANSRSRRVMERLGMSRDPADDYDHPNVPDGPLKRHVLYRRRNPALRAVTILLVRHGETEWNLQRRFQGRFDSTLTERGIAQARTVGRLLSTLPEAAAAPIVASPQGRARRSAEIIRAKLGGAGALRIDERLREHSLGSWDGLTYREVEAGCPGIFDGEGRHEWYFRAPDGESYAALAARIGEWLGEQDEAHRSSSSRTGSSAGFCAGFTPACRARRR